MAADDHSHDLDKIGHGVVRRRHSGQHEDNDIASKNNDGLQTGIDTFRSIRRTTSDPTTTSTGSDAPTSLGHELTEQPQRVRFSVDADRRPSLPIKRKRDEYIPKVDGSADVPRLADDTAVERHARGILGPPTKTSPSPEPPRPKIAPVSSARRQRGLSLRSSLFQRNMHDRSAQGIDSIIEMTDVGPSSQTGTSRSMSNHYTSKKSMDTVVEISPIQEREYGDYKQSAKTPSKNFHGLAALPHYQSWVQDRAERNAVWITMKAAYSRSRKFILRINDIPPTKDGRHIDLDPSRKTSLIDERIGRGYISNVIRSTRYTPYSFLPRQLYAQFSKLANFYFLCVSILQMIPGLSTTGTYTTIIPLLFFVTISMAKEGYDDLRRHRLDKFENNREANVLHAYRPVLEAKGAETQATQSADGPIHWAKTKWHNLQVGDVVKLERDEPAPADLVLLNSTGTNGIAFIETMALDGETNLKSKQATTSLSKVCTSLEAITACNAHFVVEDPNLDLYNFEGKVTVADQLSPLTNNEIIYRGSILRNTPEAIGMVIYSGEECKIRMNANKNPRIKAPALQFMVNRIVVVIVIFVVALAIFNTVAYQVWSAEVESKSWYLRHAKVGFAQILVSFIIMFNTMIPLSLYVSMEIVKLGQMVLLNDVDMYDEASDTPFEARTSTINEELGQISYIFSDKTGTLTDNVMKFRKVSVAGTAWLHDIDLQDKGADSEHLIHKKRRPKNKGKKPVRTSRLSLSMPEVKEVDDDGELEISRPSRQSTSQWQSSARPAKAQPELSTKDMIRYIQRRPYTMFAKKARMLLLSMALCHTCLPETHVDGHIDFQAASPDELALVRAAQELDYLVTNRESSTLTLKTYPGGKRQGPMLENYEIMDVIEFSSKRKRMSVVVRFPDQRVCVICKGADSIVMERLKLATLANQKVVEIEKKVSRRKSLEAHDALRRKSEQVERASLGRPSMAISLGRPSMTGLPRPSMTGGTKLQPIRDELNTWLSERERDVDRPDDGDVSVYYSPRPSAQVSGRPSTTPSESRSSFDDTDDDEELVEESLAIDEAAIVERCFQHINDFATEGLRTLLYGHRFLEEQEYLSWKKIYHDATTSLVDRQLLIEKAGEIIEQDLELDGATAIEDKLQAGVPESIDKLRRANIRMWMLTGDKRETAINIGQSCRLIKDYSSVTVLDHETGQVEQRIAATMLDINNGKLAHSVVVVDGQTLALIEDDESTRTLFYELAILADSVICCRASPSQKAGLVKAVRRKVKSSITLAIGDGANDIAMIQEAHVGIGITGKEGLQAARSSDYSIAQFRFLTKLLLVHGRWNYDRASKYLLCTLWKETMFYLTQAAWQHNCGFSGTSLYESWSLSMFNTLFTSLAVIFMGIFEKDLLPQTLIAVPELYTRGQRNGGFNFRIYLGWMFMAASDAMLIYFTMLALYGGSPFTSLKNDQGLYALGSITFTACIVWINTKIQLVEQHNKSIMALIAWFLSVGGWFLWMIILASIYHNNNEYDVKDGFFDRFGKSAIWWMTLILILVAVILYELGVKSLKSAYFPSDVDLFQQYERDLLVRKRFEEASATELQAGWHHGTKKSSLELQREEEVQAAREKEVQDLLNRPRVMSGVQQDQKQSKTQVVTEEQPVFVEDGPMRRSTDIREMLSRRSGDIRRG